MPYLLEDELKDQQGSQNLNAPSTVLNSPGQAKTAQKSGSYTNLQTYLDANKPQAEAMGQKVSDTVDSAGNEARNSVSQFEAAGPSQVNKVTQDDLNNQFYNDPTKADKNQYSALKSGYTGPNSVNQVQGYDKASQSTQKANELVNQAQTFDGRQNILQNVYARPDYSIGAQKLDSALLGGNAAVKNSAAQLQSKYADLNGYLDTAKNNVSNTINNNIGAGSANRQLIGGAEQQAVDNMYKGFENKANTANQDYQSQLQKYSSDMIDSALNPETLALSGVQEGTNIYDLDLKKYLSGDSNTLDASSAADSNDRAQWAALQNLIGGQDARISADGQKTLNPIAFDKQSFQNDLAAAKNNYDPVLEQILNSGMGYEFKDASGNWQFADRTSFKDIMDKGIFDSGTVQNPTSRHSSFMSTDGNYNVDTAKYTEYKKNLDEYNRLHKVISNTSKNAIKTPTGTITGGLKG